MFAAAIDTQIMCSAGSINTYEGQKFRIFGWIWLAYMYIINDGKGHVTLDKYGKESDVGSIQVRFSGC